MVDSINKSKLAEEALRTKYNVDPILVADHFQEISHEHLKAKLDSLINRVSASARIGSLSDSENKSTERVKVGEPPESVSDLMISENLTVKGREIVYLSVATAGQIFIGLHLEDSSQGPTLRATGLASKELNMQLPLRQATYTEWVSKKKGSALVKQWSIQCESDQFTMPEGNDFSGSYASPFAFQLDAGQSIWMDVETGFEQPEDVSAERIAPIAELQKEVRQAEQLQRQFLNFVHEKYNTQVRRFTLSLRKLQPELSAQDIRHFAECLTTSEDIKGAKPLRDCISEYVAHPEESKPHTTEEKKSHTSDEDSPAPRYWDSLKIEIDTALSEIGSVDQASAWETYISLWAKAWLVSNKEYMRQSNLELLQIFANVMWNVYPKNFVKDLHKEFPDLQAAEETQLETFISTYRPYPGFTVFYDLYYGDGPEEKKTFFGEKGNQLYSSLLSLIRDEPDEGKLLDLFQNASNDETQNECLFAAVQYYHRTPNVANAVEISVKKATNEDFYEVAYLTFFAKEHFLGAKPIWKDFENAWTKAMDLTLEIVKGRKVENPEWAKFYSGFAYFLTSHLELEEEAKDQDEYRKWRPESKEFNLGVLLRSLAGGDYRLLRKGYIELKSHLAPKLGFVDILESALGFSEKTETINEVDAKALVILSSEDYTYETRIRGQVSRDALSEPGVLKAYLLREAFFAAKDRSSAP